MKTGKLIFLIIAAVFIIIAAVFIFTAELGTELEIDQVEVNIFSEFENKFVYTTDSLADTGPLIEHCESAGGTFNACGSICGPEAEFCASVCAFTCEL
jgi:hypothetical protein